MKKFFYGWIFILNLFLAQQAFAILNLELTRGVAGAIPIAIAPFNIDGGTPETDVSGVVSSDLKNSGRFKVFGGDSLSGYARDAIQFDYFNRLGADNLVVGKIKEIGSNRYEVSFKLFEVYKQKSGEQESHPPLITQTFTVSGAQLRPLAHHISDLIYQQLTGIKGVFSTHLAYVVVQQSGDKTRYTLEVADQDGYNPRPLLSSFDPVMSPAWSPNGKQIAYVSFEKKHASIVLQDIFTGSRRVISESPGINGAPAWSPDGRKLAIVLSKSGSPNIYIYDLSSGQISQLTNDSYINTEPAWSPNGRSIIYTSTRSGKPQIFQIDLGSRSVSRVSFNGKYNARASFTPDGNHIIMINQDSGLYNIGILDLDTGVFRVLTNSGSDHGSPSMAPNGSMALFETVYNNRSVLGMAATDGSVQLRLPARDGHVQDPAWSP
jgi:TolB protein